MTVRVRKHLDSETVHIPELAPLVGKDVEITVVEQTSACARKSDPTALFEVVGKDVVDPEAYKELRTRSMI